MITMEQAELILQAHDILALLDDEEEMESLEANNPQLMDAYRALRRLSCGVCRTDDHTQKSAEVAELKALAGRLSDALEAVRGYVELSAPLSIIDDAIADYVRSA